MKKILLGFGLMSLMLAGCSSDGDVSHTRNYIVGKSTAVEAEREVTPPGSDKVARFAIFQKMDEILLDPTSAKYKFFPVVFSDYTLNDKNYRGWFLCGSVMSRNEYGAYTGFKPFWGALTTVYDGKKGNPDGVPSVDLIFEGNAKEHCDAVEKSSISFIPEKRDVPFIPEESKESVPEPTTDMTVVPKATIAPVVSESLPPPELPVLPQDSSSVPVDPQIISAPVDHPATAHIHPVTK